MSHDSSTSRPCVLLIAADVSADHNAGRLAELLHRRRPDLHLAGVGGSGLEAAGVELVASATHLSFTGLLGAARFLPEIVDVFRRAYRFVRDVRPELAVIVDSEAVGFPAMLLLHRAAVPVAYFFPPQVWFWGRWRLPILKRLIRRVIAPFEPEADLYQQAGADTRWVGHPLRDRVTPDHDRTATLSSVGLDPARRLVLLMPGSRRAEIDTLCEPIFSAARQLHQRDPTLQFAVPLASREFRPRIENHLAACGLSNVLVYEPDSYALMSHADLAIQCSGTATLEAALLGIPAVIVYRCVPIEYPVARFLAEVPFIGMPNILLNEMVQPELFHRDVDGDHIAAEAWPLLDDARRRDSVKARLAVIATLLGEPGALARAADAIVDLLPAPPATASSGWPTTPLRASA